MKKIKTLYNTNKTEVNEGKIFNYKNYKENLRDSIINIDSNLYFFRSSSKIDKTMKSNLFEPIGKRRDKKSVTISSSNFFMTTINTNNTEATIYPTYRSEKSENKIYISTSKTNHLNLNKNVLMSKTSNFFVN